MAMIEKGEKNIQKLQFTIPQIVTPYCRQPIQRQYWPALLLFFISYAGFRFQAVSQMSWFPRHKNVIYGFI